MAPRPCFCPVAAGGKTVYNDRIRSIRKGVSHALSDPLPGDRFPGPLRTTWLLRETVLRGRQQEDYLLLWQNDNTIVIGQNQNAEAEINRAFVEAHGIHVVRRTTGGGAVYHDLGNLNYSFITDAGDAERLTMERFTRPVVEALRGLGLRAEASGRNDILVEGRKVSGTAQRLMGKRILHHGTLLFDSNPEMVAGALNVDPAKFQSKSPSLFAAGWAISVLF